MSLIFRRLFDQGSCNGNFYFATVSPSLAGQNQHQEHSLTTLFQKIAGSKIKIEPSKRDSGVWFLLKPKQENPIAVFKIGHKRAACETVAMELATLLGLKKFIVNATVAQIDNPPTCSLEDTLEDLWKGCLKVFSHKKPIQGTILGVLEPYLESVPSLPLIYSYSMVVMLALALGLRDGKLDGVRGGRSLRLVDIEDILPTRLDPKEGEEQGEIAATQLPLLAHLLAQQKLSKRQVHALYDHVSAWSIPSIKDNLVLCAPTCVDEAAEKLEPGEQGLDSQGCLVDIEEAEDDGLHYSQGIVTSAVSCESLDALEKRLLRLKGFLRECVDLGTTIKPLDLVFAVDPFYHAHYEAICALQKDAERNKRRDILVRWSGFSKERVFDALGTKTPGESFTTIDMERYRGLLQRAQDREKLALSSFFE